MANPTGNFTTYSQFKDASASEKTALCILEAAKRLVGWTVYSGSIYQIAFSESNVITSVEDDAVALTSVSEVASVTAGKYYFDKDNDLLYVRLSNSSHPDDSFIGVVFRYFFSNNGVKAPHDLSTGFEVYWMPLLTTLSDFRLEVDNRDTQLGLAIEGGGTIRFINDQAFWSPRYDKVFFDNQRIFVYSWERTLPITQAQILFRGKIQQKSYTIETVSFQAKDVLNELRDVFDLDEIENFNYTHPLFGLSTNAIIPVGETGIKQRLIYGNAKGVIAKNVDNTKQLGYDQTGGLSDFGRELINATTFGVLNGSALVTRLSWYNLITGWSVYSGSVYSATFTKAHLTAGMRADAPTPALNVVETSSIGSVTAGKYYIDRTSNTIYIRLADSSNPNSTSVYALLKWDFTVGDKIVFDSQPDKEYSVLTFGSYDQMTLTEVYDGTTDASAQLTYFTSSDRNIHNRNFLVAGHSLSEPSSVVQQVIDGSHFYIDDASEFLVGDNIVVTVDGNDYDRVIEAITDTNLITTTVLISPTPNVGDAVKRPGVQKVYLNDQLLIQGEDYTVDSANALVKLCYEGPNYGSIRVNPEYNHSTVRNFSGRMTFVAGSQNVGSGSHPSSQTTAFTKEFKPGDYIQDPSGAWKEVWWVVSDEVLIITEVANSSGNIDNGLYKQVKYFQSGTDTIICDVRGMTSDGTTSGTWLRRAPEIVENILTTNGLTDIDATSFDEANEQVPFDVGLVLPASVSDKKAPTIRDALSQLSRSVFGTLLQNSDLDLAYSVIAADKVDLETFDRSDIVDFVINSDSSKLIKNAVVVYDNREMDFSTLAKSDKAVTKTSEIGQYLLKLAREFRVNTNLVDSTAATIMAGRWAFLLELATSKLNTQMKITGNTVSVGDAVQVNHPKLYERFGSDIKRRMGSVSLITRGATKSQMTVDDLSNAFSRVATIATASAPDYVDANDAEKVVSGYITASNGLLSSDPSTYGLNVIW